MKKPSHIKLAGSYKEISSGEPLHDLDKEQTIEVTVRLRRKKQLPVESFTSHQITRTTYERSYAASTKDVDAIEAFAQSYHLTTADVNLARRSVILTGKISDFEEAFQVELKGYQTEAGQFRALTDEVHIPSNLENIIAGVFGLDNRPIARPMFQVAKQQDKIVSHAAAPQAFTPDQLATIYGFPAGVTGNGQCIAIIELGGGFRTADITNYFKGLGIKVPSVKAIAVDGGKNNPSTADGADGEVMLDIEVAGAVAPGATIAVYFAPNTDQGFLDAITKAIHDTQNKPSVISISWGSAEVNWTKQALDNFNEAFKTAAALGVTICVAAGDSGSRDGETDGKVHVDFPASSPYVLACGGTKLVASNNEITSETVWHESADSATGGGVSDYFALPDYQQKANVPVAIDTQFKGRGVPDVAADADPNTGYKVLVDGQQMVIGGTSAVAPLMAGLIARINEQKKKPVGFIHAQLYANASSFCHDVTSGDNKTTSKKTGYSAGKGWDACTGWGVLYKL
ncbi:S8/S53 family peptidase [Mucilaginibacter robiniae]|uniref:S8/S53 family peptidase n=1 Tax=Mucilaginibacter robiniae TaxID=2728022 RepID=A0A7L5E280_9SPHI|nr:S53 family peptidase [Mucilaginibacter robiniae]QJD96419.1 S8/S53 family peptidase [Mucilaginibacter robiniae]